MRRVMAASLISAVALVLAGCSGDAGKTNTPDASSTLQANTEKVLNVYSSRHYDVDKKLYKAFTDKTGIKLNVVEGKGPQLIERLTKEKDAPAADVFLTVGAESIWQLRDAGVLGKYSSETVKKNIPEQWRGEGWMGVASRARVIAYVKGKTDPKSITSYEDLTKPEWKGKVLARSSKSSYNQALEASFITLNGEAKAKEWAQGIVNNFARDPKGNDRDQAKAIVAGVGEVAIMNSYYWVRLNKSSDKAEHDVAQKIGLIFPKDTHVNLSYAGVIKGAKHQENAEKLLEFLSSEEAQKMIAEENGEFPLNPQTAIPEPQKSWLGFTPQKLDYNEFGKNIKTATKIFGEVGWK